MSPVQYLLAFLVVLVGAAIQGAVGFGANLFAAPFLVLINPTLVPGPVVIGTSILNLLVLRRERAPHAWREMSWAIGGQLPGAIAGAAVLSIIAGKNLAIFFALLILVAVGLSLSGLHPRRTRESMAVAGLLSGFMGTAVGIGGPPIALLFQKAEGAEIRAALSRFFFVSGLVSIMMLIAFGQFTWEDLGQGLLLVPGTMIGYLVSGRLLTHVDRNRVRIAVLALSAASAVAAIVKAVA